MSKTARILFQFKLQQIGIPTQVGENFPRNFTRSSTQVPRSILRQSHPSVDRTLEFERAHLTSDELPIQTWRKRTQSPIEPGFSSRCIQSRQYWSNPEKSGTLIIYSPKPFLNSTTHPSSLFFIKTADVLWARADNALAKSLNANICLAPSKGIYLRWSGARYLLKYPEELEWLDAELHCREHRCGGRSQPWQSRACFELTIRNLGWGDYGKITTYLHSHRHTTKEHVFFNSGILIVHAHLDLFLYKQHPLDHCIHESLVRTCCWLGPKTYYKASQVGKSSRQKRCLFLISSMQSLEWKTYSW